MYYYAYPVSHATCYYWLQFVQLCLKEECFLSLFFRYTARNEKEIFKYEIYHYSVVFGCRIMQYFEQYFTRTHYYFANSDLTVKKGKVKKMKGIFMIIQRNKYDFLYKQVYDSSVRATNKINPTEKSFTRICL